MQGTPWTRKELRQVIFKEDWEEEKNRIAIDNWRGAGSPPGPQMLARVEDAIFGPLPAYPIWRADLRAARQRSKGHKNRRTRAIGSVVQATSPNPTIQPAASQISREQLLIAMLFGDFDNERRHALLELCKMQILSPAATAALERFAKESDVEWRTTAAEALYETISAKPTTSYWARLFLLDPDSEIRLTALQKLSESASKIEPEIYTALKDPAPEVRTRAANILLSRLQVTTTESFSVAALLIDEDREVRKFAATRLLDFVSERFVEEPHLLSNLLAVVSENMSLWPKLKGVVETKSHLPAQTVVPYLLDMLKDLFPESADKKEVVVAKPRRETLALQRELCIATARFGALAIDPVLERLLSKRTENVLGAIYALGEIGINDPKVVSPLSEFARLPATSLIGEAAVACLRKLTGKRTSELIPPDAFKEPPSSSVYPRISRDVHVTNRFGLNARESAQVVMVAGRFVSELMIGITRDNLSFEVSASSIMGMMSLAVNQGEDIIIFASGPDAYDALDNIEALFVNNFGNR